MTTFSRKDLEDEGRLARMEAKQDETLKEMREIRKQFESHEARIRELEATQARYAGAAGVLGAVFAQVLHRLFGSP